MFVTTLNAQVGLYKQSNTWRKLKTEKLKKWKKRSEKLFKFPLSWLMFRVFLVQEVENTDHERWKSKMWTKKVPANSPIKDFWFLKLPIVLFSFVFVMRCRWIIEPLQSHKQDFFVPHCKIFVNTIKRWTDVWKRNESIYAKEQL